MRLLLPFPAIPEACSVCHSGTRDSGSRIFNAAGDIYEQMKLTWKGNREYLLAQVIRLVERYIESDKLRIDPNFSMQTNCGAEF